MLPDRSKRYAGADGEIPRLGLATNWQLLVIALLVLALLALIYPHKVLVARLYQQDTLDELTLSYIQNLYRAESDNADVAILLARAQQTVITTQALESLLLPFVNSTDSRQRTESRLILSHAYMRRWREAEQPDERGEWASKVGNLLAQAALQDVPYPLAKAFSAMAFELNMPRLGLDYLQRVARGRTIDVLQDYAREALGRGQYAASAEFYFLALAQSTERDQERRLFMAGIGAYMAASEFRQAMLASEKYIGNLADDPETLRYLIRAALAAGDPAAAAAYARRLVFRPSDLRSQP